MTRLGCLALVLTGLAATAATAATPKWTAKGSITALRLHSITVHGKSCRITAASPARPTLRLYYVGAEAKIACANGVLRKIDVLRVLPSVTSSAPATPHGTTIEATATGNSSLVTSYSVVGNITGSRSDGMSGSFSVTALANGSITGGRTGFSISLTCTLGEGSPDVGGFQVGDALTNMQCRNYVLTSITRKPA